jgi:hypothetical protein
MALKLHVSEKQLDQIRAVFYGKILLQDLLGDCYVGSE